MSQLIFFPSILYPALLSPMISMISHEFLISHINLGLKEFKNTLQMFSINFNFIEYWFTWKRIFTIWIAINNEHKRESFSCYCRDLGSVFSTHSSGLCGHWTHIVHIHTFKYMMSPIPLILRYFMVFVSLWVVFYNIFYYYSKCMWNIAIIL